MVTHYTLRLACLCCASFFLMHTALAAATLASAPTVRRLAERLRPRTAANLIFALRMFPATAAAAAVLGLCIPSYLWLEPHAKVEPVGWTCILAAMAGTAICVAALLRGACALARSALYLRRCKLAGRETNLAEASGICLLNEEAPVLAVAGIVRPRVLVSRGVMRALSSDQLAAALRHESAHRTSCDNLKRLCLLLAPNVLPFFPAFRTLDDDWLRFTECAADDQATGGDSLRALFLAEALVRLAQMETRPRQDWTLTSSLATGGELSVRVDRLLRPQPLREEPFERMNPAIATAMSLVAGAGAVMFMPATLGVVHRLLEHLVS